MGDETPHPGAAQTEDRSSDRLAALLLFRPDEFQRQSQPAMPSIGCLRRQNRARAELTVRGPGIKPLQPLHDVLIL
jgi:hypothetical protein